MNFYYAEIKNGKVVSWGDSTNMELALQDTKERVVELTQKEYWLLSACRGDIENGIFVLGRLQKKIKDGEEL